MLTFEEANELFEYDLKSGELKWKVSRSNKIKVGQVAKPRKSGYITVSINGTMYYAHRIAWLMTYRELPELEIDHINRIKSDNKISNLRLVTRSKNCKNTGLRTTNTSGHKGVSWSIKYEKWVVTITKDYKPIYIGSFKNIEDASTAYDRASVELFPEINGGL